MQDINKNVEETTSKTDEVLDAATEVDTGVDTA